MKFDFIVVGLIVLIVLFIYLGVQGMVTPLEQKVNKCYQDHTNGREKGATKFFFDQEVITYAKAWCCMEEGGMPIFSGERVYLSCMGG